MQRNVSERAAQFTESVIRDMTRLCNIAGGVNLAQGFPDFPAPDALKEAAKRAIDADFNQYAITWGAPSFRQAIAKKVASYNGLKVDPDREITVCCGATETMIASLLAIANPGDEVIVFEPFYENYGPDAILSGAIPRFVTLHEPDWRFDPDELAATFNEKTKAIIINNPHNPSGKVFSPDELQFIADLCHKWDAVAITDEIYEHILYDGSEHISIATLDGMSERTITINGLSKTYSVTGWRIGYAVANPTLTNAIRKVHDFLTIGAAAPLQEAAAIALEFEESYYIKLAHEYAERRDYLMDGLCSRGFECFKPSGAYYIMTNFRAFSQEDDVQFSRYLVNEIGVATVPGSSFYSDPAKGRDKIRFCFCKNMTTLEEAVSLLGKLSTIMSTV